MGAGGYIDRRYLLSPRTVFPKKLYSETSTDYPIMSTRDESHTDDRYVRAHIVNGEGARSEYTTFLKHSITSYVLQAIEQGYLRLVPEIASPLESNKAIALNLDGDWSVPLGGGETMGVTDYLNTYYLGPVEELFRDNSPKDQDLLALREFKWTLGKLDEGLIESLDGSIEWVIKKTLAENIQDYSFEEELSDEAARITLLNQYMAVTDPFYDELVEENKVRTIVSEEAVERAFLEPPEESRGVLRVRLAREFMDSVKTMSWAYLKLKPSIRYESFTFNELGEWTDDKIQQLVMEIRSNIKPS